ncbi:histidine kinase dimerization/phospho-acceptor domain-containing protein [Paenibacillaceae sp. P-4]|uniref:histidine kinase dimerization/phospho-acceptor domain-containing protein n=1 Tax=Paenibacillaceae bacterium P-4 TaxID=3160969 RepID=UPI0032E80B73
MMLIHSILAHEFKGLLYIMSASLMFLIITPKFMFAHYRRKLLFIFILILLTCFYIGYEDIDPLLYGLHLTPVSLALAALFEGLLPGICTWLAFNLCTLLYLQIYSVPTIIGSTMMLAAGLILHYKQVLQSTYLKIFLMSLLLITVYLAGYLFFFDQWDQVQGVEVVIAVIGTYLSSMYVSYIYHHVKNQERMREELFRAEKYQVIGQLAASISHEIRNPLTTAQGFLQLMNRKNLTPEQIQTYRNYAASGIEQANSIITDYLNYAKPTVEVARPLYVQEELDTVVPSIRGYIMNFVVLLLDDVERVFQTVLLFLKGTLKRVAHLQLPPKKGLCNLSHFFVGTHQNMEREELIYHIDPEKAMIFQ